MAQGSPLLGALTAFGLFLPGPASAELAFQAVVLSVGDGDTIRVGRGGKPITVRLACIDAPELAQGPYGQQARQSLLARLPIGRPVRLIPKAIDR
ncbi:thermonuclease family protein [Cyanobium sp. Morenito 9A2]|uniref:thermonuclease family protein n=1 Tax=Cyanobium sp. Morenito 9A2 TaxID=2823718 RepID=UPI0020CC395C|nr:hypothetical protein [Cyanobium sp. Morenito 9A2]